MASIYEDTVLDFDLNFLQQSSKSTVVPNVVDKQRKTVLLVKKKTIATHHLVQKYYDKKEHLEQTEKSLLSSREECKKVCIDYKNVLEKYEQLERNVERFRNLYQEAENKCTIIENQYEAMQCHANQLQLLVKEHESVLEAMKIEKKLETDKGPRENVETSYIEKENATLLKHINMFSDVVFGKKKLSTKNKVILRKYAKPTYLKQFKSIEEDKSDDDMSQFDDPISNDPIDNEDDCFETTHFKVTFIEETQESTPLNDIRGIRQNENALLKCDIDRDSDNSNGVISEDTGRGSSLALSDSDKCYLSPDYPINDSPPSPYVNKEKQLQVDSSTSPITVTEIVHKATSPIIFEDFLPTENKLGKPILIRAEMVDKQVSPIKPSRKIASTQTHIKKKTKDIATSPIKNGIKGITEESGLSLQEKECLELNNSNNLPNGDISDNEVGTILNTMRLYHGFVTPLPTTPSKSRVDDALLNAQVTPSKSRVDDAPLNAHVNDSYSYPGVAESKEDNKRINAFMASMSKDMSYMKNMLMKVFGIDSNEHSNNYSEQNQLLIKENNHVLTKPLENNVPTISEDSESLLVEDSISSPIRCEELCLDETTEAEINVSNENITSQSESVSHIQFAISSPIRYEELCLDETTEAEINVSNKNITSQSESVRHIQFEETSLLESDTNSVPDTCPDQPITDKLVFEDADSENKINEDILSNKSETMDETDRDIISEMQIYHNSNQKKVKKKLSILQRLREKMVPKCKIRRACTPPISRRRQKLVVNKLRQAKSRQRLNNRKHKIKEGDSSASLNDKNVYENALKVMAELKAKEKEKQNKPLIRRKTIGKRIMKDTGKNSKKVHKKRTGIEYSKNIASPVKNTIITRSRSISTNDENVPIPNMVKKCATSNTVNAVIIVPKVKTPEKRCLKRRSIEQSDIQCKRVLRSTTRKLSTDSIVSIESNSNNKTPHQHSKAVNSSIELTVNVKQKCDKNRKEVSSNRGVNYSDIDIFNDTETSNKNNNQIEHETNYTKQHGVLCSIIQKNSVKNIRYSARISDSVTTSISKKIETTLNQIAQLPFNKTKEPMNNFVDEIKTWNYKNFISGFMKYLQEPERGMEFHKKILMHPAPPMTIQEQILLYIIKRLEIYPPFANIVDTILSSIEYVLFKLNNTPHFDVIKTMSHFYAVVCRYFRAGHRLRQFILDAMYCIQHKSVTLIKQCLDVWMHVLPLAHMGIAKNPLVMSIVYLLYFYKCDDRYNKVNDIRNILQKQYFYKITNWNDNQVLEMFTTAIKELKDIPIEWKMIRLALIILAKRQGPRWCQNNVIKKLLQPIIEDKKVSELSRQFCISMIGPLMKAYPKDMTVHCEVAINQLLDMLKCKLSHKIEEAIYTSLIYMSKHNHQQVTKALVRWKPKQISRNMESLLRDFVRERPLKTWTYLLSKISVV